MGRLRTFAGLSLALTIAILSALATGTATTATAEPSVLQTQKGTATYYAKMLHGRKTASGASFDQNAMMAAHKSWPFGTVVRVINAKNERSVKVRIVDRLGKRSKAVIDLSRRAARELRFLRTGQGRIQVRLEVLEWGER